MPEPAAKECVRKLRNAFGIPSAFYYTEKLVRESNCRSALDIGCGKSSYLSAFRPGLMTVGVDAFAGAVAEAKAHQVHDHYLVANILEANPAELLAPLNGKKYDLVTLYDVIEHVPKKLGYELLEKCEQLTEKFVLLQTPNGFLEQGPEFGNEFQRHLSGWFAHDFEGLGYQVRGATGLKLFHGYAGQFRFSFPGVIPCEVLLFWMRRADKHPRHAFSLVAWKDVRGVPARL